MHYSISDFAQSFAHETRIIAGAGGMTRPIEAVDILDYELVPGLKSTYPRKNFRQEALVLSTFLYARDNPYLILDAVKTLASHGASGLVVKNVFHLDIPETVIRYANARNFPIFLVTRETFYFDEAICKVDRAIRSMSSAAALERIVDSLLQAKCGPEAASLALEANPSLQAEHAVIYARIDDDDATPPFAQLEEAFAESGLDEARNLMAPFRNGLVLIVSVGTGASVEPMEAASALKARVLPQGRTVHLGTSSVHYSLDEVPEALAEALAASKLSAGDGEPMSYDNLGILRALIPFAQEPAMIAFERSILEPIREFDDMTSGKLEETLLAYCQLGQRVGAAAAGLEQHPNTVRYRLDKIAQITGLSYKRPSEMEQLSLAAHLARCRALNLR